MQRCDDTVRAPWSEREGEEEDGVRWCDAGSHGQILQQEVGNAGTESC